jgi:hypothetical protein
MCTFAEVCNRFNERVFAVRIFEIKLCTFAYYAEKSTDIHSLRKKIVNWPNKQITLSEYISKFESKITLGR